DLSDKETKPSKPKSKKPPQGRKSKHVSPSQKRGVDLDEDPDYADLEKPAHKKKFNKKEDAMATNAFEFDHRPLDEWLQSYYCSKDKTTSEIKDEVLQDMNNSIDGVRDSAGHQKTKRTRVSDQLKELITKEKEADKAKFFEGDDVEGPFGADPETYSALEVLSKELELE